MTPAAKAAPKPETARPTQAPGPAQNTAQHTDSLAALQTLLRTALPDLTLDSSDPTMLSARLTEAHEGWGLGLRHLRHEVRTEGSGPAEGGLVLYADGSRVGAATDDAETLAATYATMQAQDAEGRSEWAVLGEGHRFTLDGTRQMKVLVEDARDFESHWTRLPGSQALGQVSMRTGRQGEDLWVEVLRPVVGRDLLQDAAWDVVERIRDRALRRELQRRAEGKGILDALLSARSGSVEKALRRSPALHFTVSAAVRHTTERSLDAWKAMQREAVAQLDAAQNAQIDRLVALLGGNAGLK